MFRLSIGLGYGKSVSYLSTLQIIENTFSIVSSKQLGTSSVLQGYGYVRPLYNLMVPNTIEMFFNRKNLLKLRSMKIIRTKYSGNNGTVKYIVHPTSISRYYYDN